MKPKEKYWDPASSPGAGRNLTVDFKGHQRHNETHTSSTEPDARIVWKSSGDALRLAHAEHALKKNRNGLVGDAELTIANGTAERDAAKIMIARRRVPQSPGTLGASTCR